MDMLVWYWLYKLHYNVLVENILSSPNRAVGFLVVNRVNRQSSFRSCGLAIGTLRHQCNQLEDFSVHLEILKFNMDAYIWCMFAYIHRNCTCKHTSNQIIVNLSPLTTHHAWQVLLKNKWNFRATGFKTQEESSRRHYANQDLVTFPGETDVPCATIRSSERQQQLYDLMPLEVRRSWVKKSYTSKLR